MDRARFDFVAQSLLPGYRRRALRLVASLAGSALLGGAPGPATAGERRKRCKRGKKPCGARCIAKRKCCKNADCLPGQTCASGGLCRPASPGRLSAADPIWRSCNSEPGSYHFEAHPFTWPGGPIRIIMQPEGFAAALFIFERSRFNPRSVSEDDRCGGARGASSDEVDGTLGFFSEVLPPGDYVLVPTSSSPGAIGVFTIDVEQAEAEG